MCVRTAFPTLEAHQALVAAFVNETQRRPYVLPPREKWAAMTAALTHNPVPPGVLDTCDLNWASSHRRNSDDLNAKPFVETGAELREALITAHGRAHVAAPATSRALGEHIFPPALIFIRRWVGMCPGCPRTYD